MSKEFFNKNGHYFYKLILVITFLVFILLLVKDVIPFASQNAYYHSVFGSNLFSNFLDHSGILQQSQFHNGYVDQHIGFHFLVWISNLVYTPELAIKMLTCLFLSLTLFQLIRAENFSNSMLIFSSLLFFLFFQFYSFQRLFWERPQFLNLFVLVYYLNSLGKVKNLAVLFLVSLAFSLVSFETGIWITAMGIIDYLCGSKNKTYLISCISGVLLSLFIFPFGLAKIEYVITLLKHNVFDEKFISEWAGAKEWNYQHLILTSLLFISLYIPVRWQSTKMRVLQMCSLALLLLSIKIVRFEYIYFFLIFLCFIEFLSKSLKPKGKFLISFFLLIGFAFFYPRAVESFKGDAQNLYKPTRFLEWYQQSKYSQQRFVNFKWEYWSPLFYYDHYTKSEPGFSMFIYRKNKDLVNAYNFLRYHLDDVDITRLTHFFSNFNSRFLLIENNAKLLKIYREKKWPFVPLYTDEHFTFLEFRDPRISFNGYDQNKPLAEACLLENRCQSSFLKRINNKDQVDIFIPIPDEDSTFPLIPFSQGHFAYEDRVKKSIIGSADFFFKSKTPGGEEKGNYFYEFPFYRIKNKWILAEKNLLFSDPTDFLKNIDQLFEREFKNNPDNLFYILGEPSQRHDDKNRIRKMIGLLYLCKSPHTHSYGLELLKKYDFSQIDSWDLGSKSVLGLVEESLSGAEIEKINRLKESLFSRLPDLIEKHYENYYGFWYASSQRSGEIFIDRNYVFAVGEALTYLAFRQSKLNYSWLNFEIEKYYDYFIKTKDIYSIRWLLSMLFYQNKYLEDKGSVISKVKNILAIIQNDFSYPYQGPLFYKGCFYNKIEEGKGQSFSFDHHSGLIMEGLSFFSSIAAISDLTSYQKVISELSHCALKQQIRSENYFKIGGNKREIGGIRVSPNSTEIRIDILAHLGIGVYQLSKNPKLLNIISGKHEL